MLRELNKAVSSVEDKKNFFCALDKSSKGNFVSSDKQRIKGIGRDYCYCITSRYYYTINANSDNLVLEVKLIE